MVDGPDDVFLVFAEDMAFDSPSAAATAVSASNVNGTVAWKVKGTGMTYATRQQQTPPDGTTP